MQIIYNTKSDLLYLRLNERQQQVTNQRLSEEVVLDIREDDKIVGIEILDASQNVNLSSLLPVNQEVVSSAG
ncbi:MAG: DUF2283 domain-containing protein [Hormoscilla sp. GM7CHS1pb]|nr:DUF2283 domain-containing protein [Hormoscilla sp. GM7CHS1pb]